MTPEEVAEFKKKLGTTGKTNPNSFTAPKLPSKKESK
jgi:hypothetical protein